MPLPDTRTLRKRVFLRLFGHPVVILPSVLGLSAATVLWALSWRPGLGWFALVAGLVGSLGTYLTRVIFDGGRTARVVLQEAEREEQAGWQAALDDLDRRLVKADQDPRPEAALRDLRALVGAFEEAAGQASTEQLAALVEVRSRVRQLFDQSVRSLEQTLKLHATASRLQMAEARRPLLEQREKIIADIQAGIRQLGTSLVALQTLGSGDQADGTLQRLRTELDDSLQVAHRVEARLNALLEGREANPVEPALRPAAEPHVKGP